MNPALWLKDSNRETFCQRRLKWAADVRRITSTRLFELSFELAEFVESRRAPPATQVVSTPVDEQLAASAFDEMAPMRAFNNVAARTAARDVPQDAFNCSHRPTLVALRVFRRRGSRGVQPVHVLS